MAQMNKEHILKEIKRTASENGGKPLGRTRFENETGIKTSDWFGKYWAKWGDALTEAGFTANIFNEAYDENFLLEKLINIIQELKKFPSAGELKLKSYKDKSFPSLRTFEDRLGNKDEKVSKVIEYCKDREHLADVLEICLPLVKPEVENDSIDVTEDVSDDEDEIFGFVYLIKSGKFYKIGRSNSVGRREYELSIQLPEKPVVIHKIRTDDAAGIEAYWHRRFADKRKNGEWFELNASDIKAFQRRKFM